MRLHTRQQFSCGTVKTTLSIQSEADIDNSIVDHLNDIVLAKISGGIIPACSDLGIVMSEQEHGYSTATQESTYSINGTSITVKVVLTVRKAGIERTLNHILGHELVEFHSLPITFDSLTNNIMKTGPFGGLLDSLFGGDNPLGDLLDQLRANNKNDGGFRIRDLGSFALDDLMQAGRTRSTG